MSLTMNGQKRTIQGLVDECLKSVYDNAGNMVVEKFTALATHLAEATPVRTGFARSQWRTNMGSEPHEAGATDPRWGDRRLSPISTRLGLVSASMRRLLAKGQDVEAVLYNPTRYFFYIEYGGGATPAYMPIRLTIQWAKDNL